MNLNLKGSEQVGVVGRIDPDATVASTVTSGWIDSSKFKLYLAVVQAGTLGASATVDAKLQQATDGSGTGAKDITGKAITQLTQAGTDDDKDVVINLRPQQDMDLDNSFTHFRLSITVAVATSDIGGIVLGIGPRSGPATDHDLTTVDEVVG
jgi:hypothetical protein